MRVSADAGPHCALPGEASLSGCAIGPYKLLDPIDRGAHGVLYRAWHKPTDRIVAVKVLRQEHLADDDLVERFRAEPKRLARFEHPNVVRVLDGGEAIGPGGRGYLFIVMEFLEGVTLADCLHSDGPLSQSRALAIAAQLLDAIKATHENGLVHRDLKPANVFLARSKAGSETVKLLDFGVARDHLRALTTQGAIIGTLAYMSPEQLASEPVNGASDLFSFALIVCEMLSGASVLHGDSGPRRRMKEIKAALRRSEIRCIPELHRLLSRMLQPAPAERPDLGTIASELEAVADRISSPTRAFDAADTAQSSVGESRPTEHHHRPRLYLAAAAVITVCSLPAARLYYRHCAFAGISRLEMLAAGANWTAGRTEEERASMARLALPAWVKEKFDRQIPHVAALAPFGIDEHEVTWQQIADWLNAMWFVHVTTETDSNHERWIVDWRGRRLIDDDSDKTDETNRTGVVADGWFHFKAADGMAWHPAEKISYDTAKAYCEFFGKRLPTEDEWEFAYRRFTNRYFPWGDDPPSKPGDCRMAVFDRDPAATDPTAQCAHRGLPVGAVDVREDNRDVVEGVKGLMGNVSEWTDTRYVDPKDEVTRQKDYRVVRGGNHTSPWAFGISSVRQRYERGAMRIGIGFRCAQ